MVSHEQQLILRPFDELRVVPSVVEGRQAQDERVSGTTRRSLNMYRAVIFDVDGTFVDSNDAHAHAWVLAITDSGRHVEFSRVRPLIFYLIFSRPAAQRLLESDPADLLEHYDLSPFRRPLPVRSA